MNSLPEWRLTKEEQKKFTGALTDVLSVLRAKVGISQGELAALIGLTRQTISMIESGKRPMSWQTYLALILFFDYSQATHKMLRDMDVFPTELVERFNCGSDFIENNNLLNVGKRASELSQMLQALDEKGLHALYSMLLVEYARCTDLPVVDIKKSE